MRRPALPVPPRYLALGAILVLAVIVRFWGLDFGLPLTQARPDETQIIDVNLKFLSGNLKPDFFDYPWLYMWVSTALYLVFAWVGVLLGWYASVADFVGSWPYHWAPFFLINRALSATLGSLTVLAVYGTARRLWDDRTALVAAFFMALAFIHVRDSHFGSTDAMMTILIVLSTMWLVDGHLTGNRRSFVLAGVMGGLATATKYNAGVIMFPVLVSQAVQVIESRRTGEKPAFDGRMFWFGVPCAAAFLVGVPFLLNDYADFRDKMTLLEESMRVGTGTISNSLGNGWWHHLRFSLFLGVGGQMLLFGLIGAIFALKRRAGLALVLLAFPLIYFGVIGSVRNLFFRYAIPIVPFVCLFAAWTAVQLGQWIAAKIDEKHVVDGAKAAPLIIFFVAMELIGSSVRSVFYFDKIASQTDNRVVVSRWFNEHIPAGASIAQSGSGYGYVEFTPWRFDTWRWDGRARIFTRGRERRPAIGKPDYLIVQDSPLPSTTQEEVKALLGQGYLLVTQFPALKLDRPRVYDMQDAFFIPFAGFSDVTRPGPNFALYKYVGQ